MPDFIVELKPHSRLFLSYQDEPRVTIGADRVTFRLTDAEHTRVTAAIARHFVEVGDWGEKDLAASAYYDWCQKEQVPFVKVSRVPSGKRRCEVDTYTTRYDLSREGVERVVAIFKAASRFRPRNEDDRRYDVGPNWCVCEHITPAKAREVALALFETASQFGVLHGQ